MNNLTAKKNVELFTKMWELLQQVEGTPTACNIEAAINEGLADMKTQLRWSLVYHVTDDGQTDQVLFEGADTDCTDYVIDHPELKGHCVISPNY